MLALQDGEDLVRTATSAGADAFYFPAAMELVILRQWGALLEKWNPQKPGSCRLILGVSVHDLEARKAQSARERVTATGAHPVDAMMLEAASLGELKAGRAFQRLSKLRQQGSVRDLFLGAGEIAEAQWMIENTPAHAVMLPFGLADQTAAFTALGTAMELGTAVLARRPTVARWSGAEVDDARDVSFRIATRTVTALVESLPASVASLNHLLGFCRSMPEQERLEWWSRFKAEVPPPPKARSGHPPEFAS